MKRKVLIVSLLLCSITFLHAQSISSSGFIVTGSVMQCQGNTGYALVQPMYHVLIQPDPEEIADQLSVGLSNEQDKPCEIKVYPNPFTESITIDLNANQEGVFKIEVYNMLGAKVVQAVLNNSLNGIFENQIDLSEFPVGMYVLKTIYSGKEGSKETLLKLIKR